MNVPEQDMPDVFQDVFHSVARGIRGFRRDRPSDTFRGWLRTITQNHVRDYYRRQVRQVQPTGGTDAQRRLCDIPMPDSGDAVDDDTSSVIHAREHEVLYQTALALVRPHFHEQTWLAFWRVAVEGRSPGEVAEELSMQPGTVRVAKSRVLHRLRQELGDLLD